jgi:hypothetical protein
VREIVEAIEALRLSPPLAARLATNGRKLVMRRFTWKRNAEHVLELMDRARPQVRGTTRLSRRA